MAKKPMRIVISHVYANGNNGDAALLSVLLSDIHRAFGNPELSILTMDKIHEGEVFEGVPVYNAFIYEAINHYNNPFLKIFYSFFVIASTFFICTSISLNQKRTAPS